MTKFEEIFNQKTPNKPITYEDVPRDSLTDNWEQHIKRCNELIKKVNNRKPLVDFKPQFVQKEKAQTQSSDILLFLL